MKTENRTTGNREPTPTEIRFMLRDEARRQKKIPPAVLKLIEHNLAIAVDHLDHLEKQERFLIGEFLKMCPCPWCDSDVGWFEALPPDKTFSFADVHNEHRCPHCDKRLVYAVPFMGPWHWRKHKDDLNPNRVARG